MKDMMIAELFLGLFFFSHIIIQYVNEPKEYGITWKQVLDNVAWGNILFFLICFPIIYYFLGFMLSGGPIALVLVFISILIIIDYMSN